MDEKRRNAMGGGEEVVLAQPYKVQTPTGYGVNIEDADHRVWIICPNADMAIAIEALLKQCSIIITSNTESEASK